MYACAVLCLLTVQSAPEEPSVSPNNYGRKMVHPYLAKTVPALEVSTHSGWPVLITVLIIQASPWLVVYELHIRGFSFDRPLALRARGLSKLSHSCATRKPLAAIV